MKPASYYLPGKARIALLGGILTLLAACSEPEAPVVSGPGVTILKVAAQDVPVKYEFVGKTSSSRRVEIRSRVEGFLEQRLYDEGEIVQEGQPMFQMDKKPFEAQLQAANAELAQQQARLINAEANLKRVKPLAEQNAVAQKELDDALGTYRSAAAAVEAAKAKVVQAELNLGYTTIISPVTGISSFARKREGSYIGFGTEALLTYVARIQPMWVEFSLSENQIFRIRSDAKAGLVTLPEEGNYAVEIELADGTIYPEQGLITFSDASLSEETGTFLMRAEVANTASDLRPGQFVRVFLIGALRPDAILVPQKAVQQGAQGSFVWLLDKDGKTRLQPVKLGPWFGSQWFIEEGLRDGDTVIVDGAQKVRPGIQVEATPFEAGEPAAG